MTTSTNSVTLPTLATIRDVILSRLIGSPGLAGADTHKGGFFWQLANAFASQGRNLLVRAASAWLDCNPSSAKGNALVAWADTVLGEGAALATAWVGTIEVRCSNNTATVLTTQTGTTSDGTAYRVTNQIDPTEWISGGGGTYYYAITAAISTTLGTVANKEAGEIVSLSSPPAGVYESAYISTTTTEAEDAETEAELQERIAQHLRDRPGGGSCADFRAWCQEVPGVYDAMIYPRWDGVGVLGDNTVRVIPLGPPGARMLTATEVAATLAYLEDRAPLFVIAPILVALPVALDQNVTCNVKCADGYESDYSDITYLPVVGVIDAALRKINLSVNPVGNLVPGNRVVCHCTDGKSYQFVVQSVAVGYIIVAEAWVSDPVGGKNMLAGGPLWQPIRDAIEAAFDNLGTSVSSTAGKARWPDSGAELPSTLYRSDLFQALEGITGVISSTIAAPAADVPNTAAENTAPDLIRLAAVGADPDLLVQWSRAT